jgi:hypothetical protein
MWGMLRSLFLAAGPVDRESLHLSPLSGGLSDCLDSSLARRFGQSFLFLGSTFLRRIFLLTLAGQENKKRGVI